MKDCVEEIYKGYQIAAGAQADPLAGEGVALTALFRPFARVSWRDAQGEHETLVEDPKRQIFVEPLDAQKVALGLAKRHIDRELAPLP
jgi:anti-sigma factor RsiW